MKKNTITKKLVVMFLAALMVISMIPATAEAASTSSSLYRRAKSTQEKLTRTAEYYGYYTEVSLSSNTSTKVTWSLKYTNTENEYFKLTQVTTKKGSKIKTVYKKNGKTYSYGGIVKSLKKYKTQNGYALMDKSAELADDIVAEAEKLTWTCSDFKETAKKSAGTTSFKATNKAGQLYQISVSRVTVDSKKSVKTVYKLGDKETTKDNIIASLKKYA